MLATIVSHPIPLLGRLLALAQLLALLMLGSLALGGLVHLNFRARSGTQTQLAEKVKQETIKIIVT